MYDGQFLLGAPCTHRIHRQVPVFLLLYASVHSCGYQSWIHADWMDAEPFAVLVDSVVYHVQCILAWYFAENLHVDRSSWQCVYINGQAKLVKM